MRQRHVEAGSWKQRGRKTWAGAGETQTLPLGRGLSYTHWTGEPARAAPGGAGGPRRGGGVVGGSKALPGGLVGPHTRADVTQKLSGPKPFLKEGLTEPSARQRGQAQGAQSWQQAPRRRPACLQLTSIFPGFDRF